MAKRNEIKKGDVVTIQGHRGKQTVTDIQYVHNRYQLEGISGWQYGTERLTLQHKINYAMAWFDLKTIIERGEITVKEEQVIHVSDLQKVMDELEIDARE